MGQLSRLSRQKHYVDIASRLWKRELFVGMVDVLVRLRDSGELGAGVAILLTPHDGND